MDHNSRRPHYEDEHHIADRTTRRSDLILHVNEFAHIGDQTTGQIITYVGPMKTSLQNTEMPKTFDPDKKAFKDVSLEDAIQTMITAPTGWYVILKNPAPRDEWPKTGKANDPIDLKIGVKVNIPGPCNWPLWPGQMHRLVEGHRLRTNHYLMCRVYDAKAAMENWETAVVEKQKEETIAQTSDSDQSLDTLDIKIDTDDSDSETSPAVLKDIEDIPELSNGQRIIVKGTDVSFFIPPTGLEVVPEEITKNKAKYIRNALTLENLEYCILLDEDGNTRYVRGPQVVFPTPTERFLKDTDGNKKWRALELNEITGIYTKVIKAYTDPDTGEEFEVGERFITGRTMKFYFPRAEEEIISYQSNTGSKQDRHFAVAIPEGDGRYILDRGCRENGNTGGKVSIIDGPKMYLADPRFEVFVRRVLTIDQCNLWFPGNREVIEYNQTLKGISRGGDDFVSESVYQNLRMKTPISRDMMHRGMKSASYATLGDAMIEPELATTFKKIEEKVVGSGVERRDDFTKPREIELDTKFQGVVSIDIWPGYAVQVVSKTNRRETVVGPITRKLEFSETLMPMEVSTGKPKTTDNLKKFVYLKIHANKISDIIENIETSDLYKFDVKLSYRVNFLEKHKDHENVDFKSRWFSVENYVKFLADNCRSRVKALMKQHSIEEVYANGYAMIRDIILGPQIVNEDTGESDRPLLFFEENGMIIYDVEILTLRIQDTDLTEMLNNMKRTVMQNNLKVKASESNLNASTRVEEINRKINDQERETLEKSEENRRLKSTAITDTDIHNIALNMISDSKQFEKQLAEIISENERIVTLTQGRIQNDELSRSAQVNSQEDLDKIANSEFERDKKRLEIKLDNLRKEMEIRIEEAEKMANADAIKLKAINEKMVAALEQLAAASTFATASDSLAPLAIVKGTSLAGVMTEMLEGTIVGDKLKQLMPQINKD